MFYGLCGLGNWGYSNWGFPAGFGVWGWIGWVLNLVFWVALLGILMLLVVRAARRARVQTSAMRYAATPPTAKEILQARYARSEITREQYEHMKKDIE